MHREAEPAEVNRGPVIPLRSKALANGHRVPPPISTRISRDRRRHAVQIRCAAQSTLAREKPRGLA